MLNPNLKSDFGYVNSEEPKFANIFNYEVPEKGKKGRLVPVNDLHTYFDIFVKCTFIP